MLHAAVTGPKVLPTTLKSLIGTWAPDVVAPAGFSFLLLPLLFHVCNPLPHKSHYHRALPYRSDVFIHRMAWSTLTAANIIFPTRAHPHPTPWPVWEGRKGPGQLWQHVRSLPGLGDCQNKLSRAVSRASNVVSGLRLSSC